MEEKIEEKPSKYSLLWENCADGIYKYTPSGTYYERPKIDGKLTHKSLKTKSLKLAKEELVRRNGNPRSRISTTVKEVLDCYEAKGCPDRYNQDRPELMGKAEKANCTNLHKFWDKILVSEVTAAKCDKYEKWRKKNLARAGTGSRTVDLDLNTLRNALIYAARCEVIDDVPLNKWPNYCRSTDVKHCREFMPNDSKDLHRIAGILFEKTKSEPLGWQLLVESYTGLRTVEVLKLKWDALPYSPGWMTEDGGSMSVDRVKGQRNVNPYATMNDGLRATLLALKKWKEKRYPNSPWLFPGRDRQEGGVLDKSALGHRLVALRARIGRKIISHGMRAFFVTVRRSNGISDVQIAYEIGHTSGGKTLAEVYGGVPPEWLAGNGPKMKWLPEVPLAWEAMFDRHKIALI
jgi:integrase